MKTTQPGVQTGIGRVLSRYLVLAMLAGGCLEADQDQPRLKHGATEGDSEMQTAMFAAGCFWGVEAAFAKVDGVAETEVGYSGGTVTDPTYRQVCSGRTGHAEAVRVRFDPGKLSYRDLLALFWNVHNPTTPNRQGPDIGTQYRSVVFYANEEQKTEAEAMLRELDKSGRFGKPVVTLIRPTQTFYRAEEYHQRYLEKNRLRQCR